MKFLIALLLMAVVAPLSAHSEVIKLTPKNTVVIRGVVMPDSMQRAQQRLSDLVVQRGLSKYTIYIVVDSPGGSVDAGLNFIEFAKTVPNVKTITMFAASMGSAIVEHLPGERLMLENGTFMFHRAAGSFSGYFEDGEVEERLKNAKELIRAMETKNAKRLSVTLEEYKKRVKAEWWGQGEGAIKDKMADRIVDISCSRELVQEKVTELMQVFVFMAPAEFSGCPLMREGKIIEKPQQKEPL